VHLSADVMRVAMGRRAGYVARVLALVSLSCGSDQSPSGSGPPAYLRLSDTGLYSDLATRTLAGGVRTFEPTYKLWSDGADKTRWILLPEGGVIDTTDMNRWVFPIGTQLWKEFSLDARPLETRLIERYGPGPSDYWMGSFVWQDDGADALVSEEGAENVLGTDHDVPARERCPACHNGEPGRALGFSALQLADSPLDLDLERLGADGLLSSPPPPDASYSVPGDADAAAAFGYLHANCGSCHNPRGTSWPDTQMLLRLGLDGAAVQTTPLIESVVGQRLQYYRGEDAAITLRVVPGHPEASGIIARMNVRGPMEQMPPLATEKVDEAGVDLVERWIASLPP
jgi:hypothetical protein